MLNLPPLGEVPQHCSPSANVCTVVVVWRSVCLMSLERWNELLPWRSDCQKGYARPAEVEFCPAPSTSTEHFRGTEFTCLNTVTEASVWIWYTLYWPSYYVKCYLRDLVKAVQCDGQCVRFPVITNYLIMRGFCFFLCSFLWKVKWIWQLQMNTADKNQVIGFSVWLGHSSH